MQWQTRCSAAADIFTAHVISVINLDFDWVKVYVRFRA
jgi:hypothetical protein